MSTSLTARQNEILDVIERLTREPDLAPSLGDLAKALGIRRQTVQQHVQALLRKGVLRSVPGQARSVRPVTRSSRPASRTIEILGSVAAGGPDLAVESSQGAISVDASRFRGEACFGLRVKGDSMKCAGILAGDVVIVRKQATANPTEIVVALVSGEDATVKRFVPHGGRIELRPANPVYDTQMYEASEVQILGKVIGVQRFLE